MHPAISGENEAESLKESASVDEGNKPDSPPEEHTIVAVPSRAIVALRCTEIPQCSSRSTEGDKTFPLFGNEISDKLFDWLIMKIGCCLHPILFQGDADDKIGLNPYRGLPKAELFMLISVNRRCRDRIPRNNLLFSTAALQCLKFIGIEIRAPFVMQFSSYDEVRMIQWTKLNAYGSVEDLHDYLREVRGFLEGSTCINSTSLDSQCDCGGEISGDLHELLNEAHFESREVGKHTNALFAKWAKNGVGTTIFRARCNMCPYHVRVPFMLIDDVICREPTHEDTIGPKDAPPSVYYNCNAGRSADCSVIVCEYCAAMCDNDEDCKGEYCNNCITEMACPGCGVRYCIECDGDEDECVHCDDLVCDECIPGKADTQENCALAVKGEMPVPPPEERAEKIEAVMPTAVRPKVEKEKQKKRRKKKVGERR